jgi:hypothetical protein
MNFRSSRLRLHNLDDLANAIGDDEADIETAEDGAKNAIGVASLGRWAWVKREGFLDQCLSPRREAFEGSGSG